MEFRTHTKVRVKTSVNLEDISFHESAHAFVIWRSGGKLKKVTLAGLVTDSKDSKESTTPYFCEFETPDLLKLQEEMALRAKAAMAPAAAEVQRGKKISGASLNDIRELMGGLAWGNSEVQEMAEDAMRLLKKGEIDWEASALNFFKLHGLEIRKIIDDPLAEKCIDELSKKLLSEGEIDGHGVVALFEKICSGRPEKAWPARYHYKNSKIDSLPAAIKKTSELTKLALDLLRGYRDRDVGEEILVDRIAARLIEALLEIDQAFSKL